ncbi:glycerophosphodiester phosphodiesterase [Anaerosinus gibii]|uniref:Glycerophosphodiester phosphodiesterase n=1 Tax=Selenobaculum gibii TaxID=3054208 RepID=A0A9Y2AHL1_9FIRM|nr:glycerophosphodiester phosphodiesterase [Selenobaculum gbiensis]WIW69997.1 glycerophosphodiester phosphodiesterase [Selenobaculum gbiensis]
MQRSKVMRRMVIAGLTAAVIGLGGSFVSQQQAYAKASFDVFDFEPHRGGRDARPENTLYSYAYAMEMGATSIECDMQLTKDNRIVMSHNPILNHKITRDKNGNYVEDGKYDIRLMTLDEIRKFDVGVMDPNCGEYYEGHGKTQITVPGAQIPTLDELFELIQEYGDKKVIVNAETKSYPDPLSGDAYKNSVDPVRFVKAFNDVVKKYGMEDRVLLQSFDWRTLIEMKKLNPNISLVALWQEQPSWGPDAVSLRAYQKGKSPWLGGLDIDDYQGNPILAAKAIGVDIVSPYYPEISKQDVDLAHELGMKVVPWTVNSVTDINMMIDMGVDGMISDKPWVLRSVLEKRGIKLHEPMINPNSKYHTGVDYVDVKTKKMAGGGDSAE